MSDWTFFSNYGHVLVCLARDNEARLRDVAADVGITERAAQKIVKDMQAAGYLTVTKHGRRNRYKINKRKSLRHPLESHCSVGKLLSLIAKPARAPVKQTESRPEPPARPDPVPQEVATRYPSAEADKPAPGKPVKKAETKTEKKEDMAGGPVIPDTREQGSLF